MVFSSLTFLWIFLPIELGINYLFSFIKDKKIRMNLKNVFLLIFSLIFYTGGGISYLLIMLCSITCNYFFAILIDNFEKKGNLKFKKLTLVISTGRLSWAVL
jgi:alginate O-acetyltransferase complex protein AlgI